ncbi:MAG: bifunctional homocysteine S-methyltransferase/methylenetetrahydrofolate reductase, partial [Desulfuromonas sp.]
MSTEHFPPRSRLFIERIGSGILVADGAMGTELYKRGVRQEANLEHLNLVDPQRIAQVHDDYLAAGSGLIETNTFGANRARLEKIGLEKKVVAINQAGVRIARQAAGDNRFVAGSVGPLPVPRGDEPLLSMADKRVVLREQMEAQAEAGVDLFLLETFAELEELELALQIAAACGLPAVAQMTFLEGGRTRTGVAVEAVGRRLEQAAAAVIGVNCGSGPREALALLERLASTSELPLSAFPNAGFPDYLNGRYMYLATPEYFAERGRELVGLGANLLGGCCGTGPEHIRALCAAVEGLHPVARKPLQRSPLPVAPQPREGEASRRTFLDAHQQRHIVTVELHAPRGSDCRKILSGASQLAAAGVDAISLAENPLARIRMGNIALANKIQQEAGVEVITHITG